MKKYKLRDYSVAWWTSKVVILSALLVIVAVTTGLIESIK